MKKSDDQRKKDPGKRILFGLIPCIPLSGIMYVCKFVIPGYTFTALVCLGLIAVILFYTLMPLLAVRFPLFARIAVITVTVALCIGCSAALITEGLILSASMRKPKEHVDYIVILGAKVREDGPSVSLWDRIYAAKDYLSAHPDTVAVCSGGQGSDEHMTEAQAMFNELVAMGISPDRILREEYSTNTRENLSFSIDLIERRTGNRPTRLGVVSSEYHMLRAGMVAKDIGVEFVGIPAHTSRLTQLINHCMREIPAVWKYAIFGGNGND